MHLLHRKEFADGFQGALVLGDGFNEVGFMFTLLLCKVACKNYNKCDKKRLVRFITTGGSRLKDETERNIVNTFGQIILSIAEDFINNNIWSVKEGEIDWIFPIDFDIEFKNLIEEREVKNA